MDPKNDVDVASSELQSSYRSSCGQEYVLTLSREHEGVFANTLSSSRASGTEQRLPDELLEMIAQEADFDDLKNLALTNKWLSEVCKPMLWRSVVIEGDFEEHEDRMVRLVRAGVGRYIRKIHCTQTRPFSKLSAFHLITFTDLRIAILNPPAPAAETVEAKHSAVPLALSDALKQLPKLTYLSLDRHRSFADTSFSLARHIPQLQELLIPYFPYSNQHSDRPFIHPSPPALRRLEIGFDVLAAQAVASTAGTVQQLLIGNRMFGDWDVEPLALFVELQRVFEELVKVSRPFRLKAGLELNCFQLLKGMPTTPWALDNLWLAGFQMGSDPEHLDGLLGVLSALQESPITRLRISGFFSFEYSMDDRTFTLPSVTQLDLQTDIEDVRRDFLTEVRC